MALIRALVNEGGGMLADTGDQDKSDFEEPSSSPPPLLYLLPLPSF